MFLYSQSYDIRIDFSSGLSSYTQKLFTFHPKMSWSIGFPVEYTYNGRLGIQSGAYFQVSGANGTYFMIRDSSGNWIDAYYTSYTQLYTKFPLMVKTSIGKNPGVSLNTGVYYAVNIYSRRVAKDVLPYYHPVMEGIKDIGKDDFGFIINPQYSLFFEKYSITLGLIQEIGVAEIAEKTRK